MLYLIQKFLMASQKWNNSFANTNYQVFERLWLHMIGSVQSIFQFSKKFATFKSPFFIKTPKLATFGRRHYCSCQHWDLSKKWKIITTKNSWNKCDRKKNPNFSTVKMGAQQSTRRLTVINDEAAGVIKVCDLIT